MPVDRSSDAFRRFERALDGLKTGSHGPDKAENTRVPDGAETLPASPVKPVGPSLDPGRDSAPGQGFQMDDFDQDTVDIEREQRRRSRLMPVGIALVILAAFGGVVWFAFTDPGDPQGQQTVELIQADPAPVKSKPENPGGMRVEHQDKLILNPDPEKPQIERLLPPPEAPMPVTTVTETAAPGEESAEEAPQEVTPAQTAETGQSTSASLLKKPGNRAEQAADSAAETADEVTKVIGNASNGDAAAAAKSAAQAEEAAPRIPDAPAVKDAPVAAIAEIPAPPAPAPSPKPAAPKASASNAATQLAQVPTDSGYVLQLASLKSEQDALQEWKRIQNGNKNLLAQMKAIVEKAEIEGIGTRYRLQTGPFPTKATAQDLCAQLKAAKQDCLVKRR